MNMIDDDGLRWLLRATNHPGKFHEEWTRYPTMRQQIPVGRTFELVDVPHSAGCHVLHLAGTTGTKLGPVATEDDRILFFVRVGSIGPLAQQLPVTDAVGGNLGVRYRMNGDFIIAPPLEQVPHVDDCWLLPPVGTSPFLPCATSVIGAIISAANLTKHDSS